MRQAYLLYLLTLLVSGYYSEVTAQTISQQSDTTQARWLEALNERKSLAGFYNDQSGLLRNDKLHTTTDEILSQLMSLRSAAGRLTYESIETSQLIETQKFEFGRYITIDGSAYYSIIGWRNADGWHKEFEAIYPAKFNIKNETPLVDPLRLQWQTFSNQHRPDLIAKKVFSGEGNYLNRGIHSRGMEIAEAYAYMNDESYTIKLEPVTVHQVNEHTIFEIGIYDVGGKDVYALIWRKEGDDWKLLMDFNF